MKSFLCAFLLLGAAYLAFLLLFRRRYINNCVAFLDGRFGVDPDHRRLADVAWWESVWLVSALMLFTCLVLWLS